MNGWQYPQSELAPPPARARSQKISALDEDGPSELVGEIPGRTERDRRATPTTPGEPGIIRVTGALFSRPANHLSRAAHRKTDLPGDGKAGAVRNEKLGTADKI